MAFLFVDSLTQNNSRLLQISVKSLELLLLSAGLISTVVVVKGVMARYPCELVFSSLVDFFSSIRCFLSSPLPVCIIIHVTVVLIVVSSTFRRRENDNQEDAITVSVDDHDVQIVESFVVSQPPPAAAPPPPSPPRDVFEVTPPPPSPQDVTEVAAATPETPSSRMSSYVWPNSTGQNDSQRARLSDANGMKKTAYSLSFSTDLFEPTKENIAPNNLNPPLPGKLKEEFMEDEEEDTMEATWKAITGGGKQRPKKKHLKKSETWDIPPRRSVAVQRLDSEEVLPTTPKWKELRKAETFNDAVSVTRRGGLRRGPSMSLDEFNQKVEAFIKTFNDKMRLERQESNQRQLDMINRGI